MNYNPSFPSQNQAQFSNPNNFQNFQTAQFFLQPQGSTFVINNLSEIGNIPAGVGVTAVICQRENLLYLKTLQNGVPVTVGYRISPLDGENTQKDDISKFTTTLDEHENRLKKLEELLTTKQKGGSAQWPL